MNLKKTYKRRRKNYKRTKKLRNKKKFVGGTLLSTLLGLPQINMMADFSITEETINKFSRFFKSQTDCVITALQMMKVFDDTTAEMFRVSEYLKKIKGIPGGISQFEIELFCMIKTGYNFDLRFYNDITQWRNVLVTLLPVGRGVCCWGSGQEMDHAFIIFKGHDNKLYLIDPQSADIAAAAAAAPYSAAPAASTIYCKLENDNCYRYLSNVPPYGILFRSTDMLNQRNAETLKKYITRDLPALHQAFIDRDQPQQVNEAQQVNEGQMEEDDYDPDYDPDI